MKDMSLRTLLASSSLALCLTCGSAAATFITYAGGTTAETSWRTAAGITTLENFDSYSAGNQIQTLPLLGVGFDPIDVGLSLYPGIYSHYVADTPSLSLQLSNMPSGSPTATYRYADIELYVLSGYALTALGFWNGDPNGPMTITVYDISNNVLGSVSAATNPDHVFDATTLTFAGFVSDVAIARVHFEGNTGDGWNHIDDLQTNAIRSTEVPEPSSLAMFALGLAGVWLKRRKRIISGQRARGRVRLAIYRHRGRQLEHENRLNCNRRLRHEKSSILLD